MFEIIAIIVIPIFYTHLMISGIYVPCIRKTKILNQDYWSSNKEFIGMSNSTSKRRMIVNSIGQQVKYNTIQLRISVRRREFKTLTPTDTWRRRRRSSKQTRIVSLYFSYNWIDLFFFCKNNNYYCSTYIPIYVNTF